MLNIHNLHAHVATDEGDKSILRGVDLTVNAGEIHIVLGPNGSGKSTLGRVILGDEQYEVTDGHVALDDQRFDELEPHERAQTGYFLSFQQPPEIDGVSAKDLLYAAKKHLTDGPVSAYKFSKQLKENLATVHLPDSFVDREINKGASGGERRKIEMASLLSLGAKVAFLDEIDSGIDVDGLHAVADAVKNFTKDKETAVVLISHGKRLLELIQPTHAHAMVRGRIVASGGTELIQDVHNNGFGAYVKQAGGLAISA